MHLDLFIDLLWATMYKLLPGLFFPGIVSKVFWLGGCRGVAAKSVALLNSCHHGAHAV